MAFPHEGPPCGMEVSSIRHSDDESYGCEGSQCFAALSSSMSLFTVIPQGPFESNGRKQLSLLSCGWVLILSGQFKITPGRTMDNVMDTGLDGSHTVPIHGCFAPQHAIPRFTSRDLTLSPPPERK